MKLYDLPQRTKEGVKIYGLQDTKGNDLILRFGHIDGMYSYCWVEDKPEELFHLSAVTILEKYKDGYRVIED